jgi:hypothetical protein
MLLTVHTRPRLPLYEGLCMLLQEGTRGAEVHAHHHVAAKTRQRVRAHRSMQMWDPTVRSVSARGVRVLIDTCCAVKGGAVEGGL